MKVVSHNSCACCVLVSCTAVICGKLCVKRSSKLHQYLATITSFDPVSGSTPAAVVTEIDEDSAFTEAHDILLVLLTHGKRQSFEMNASDPVREDGAAGTTVPRLVATAGGGTQVVDDIGDLDETQGQEPGSKRRKEGGNAAKDLLDQLRQDALVRD